MSDAVELSFEDVSPAEASMLVQSLEEELLSDFPTVSLNLKKERPDSQDFGTTLTLVLGTPVAIALARSIGQFLQRNSGASIKISKSGELIAKNLNSGDVARIAEALAGKKD